MRPSARALVGLTLASVTLAHSDHAEVIDGATYAEIHMAQEHHMVRVNSGGGGGEAERRGMSGWVAVRRWDLPGGRGVGRIVKDDKVAESDDG